MLYNKNMRLVFWLFGLVLLSILVSGIVFLVKNTNDDLEGYDTLEGRWIDCMPLLDVEAERICEEVERQNYPYIAY